MKKQKKAPPRDAEIIDSHDIDTAMDLGEVLAKRPLELFLPRHRGWLARMGDLWPKSALAIGPFLRRRGRSSRASSSIATSSI